MHDHFYSPESTAKIRRLKELRPDAWKAWMAFDREVFNDGALDSRTKHLMGLAIAHVTGCPWCLDAHARKAKQLGASDEQLAEASFVAMAMAAGAAFSHAAISFTTADSTPTDRSPPDTNRPRRD